MGMELLIVVRLFEAAVSGDRKARCQDPVASKELPQQAHYLSKLRRDSVLSRSQTIIQS